MSKRVKLSLAAAVSAALLLTAGCATQSVPQADDLQFAPIAFGQSTDLNFATNVLPDKVGFNYVTDASGKILDDTPLPLKTPFTVESRGGKIGNSHDGLTFYYAKIPAAANFRLEALVELDALGPENQALPAGQEGCGLLVRDSLGKARAPELLPGQEEFPAASNMVMTAMLTDGKKDHTTVQATQIDRNGVNYPYGNPGVAIERSKIEGKIDLKSTPKFRLLLERTDKGFISGYAPAEGGEFKTHECGYAQRLGVIEPEAYYLGFFASRNAALKVLDVKLSLSEAGELSTEQYQPKPMPLYTETASDELLPAEGPYTFKFRANKDGSLQVSLNGQQAAARDLKAGEFAFIPVEAKSGDSLSWSFAGQSGLDEDKAQGTLTMQERNTDATVLYAAPKASAANKLCTQAAPCTLSNALKQLPEGGTLKLADGNYPLTEIGAELSGQPGQLKTIEGSRKAVIHGLNLNASYFAVNGITVTEKSFNIAGSYNQITDVEAHHCDDTGIWVATPANYGRPLWASYNVITDCISHENKDPGNINADGFAVKMRVGEGNRLVNAISWGNADDGYDLFNKIEDGPNGKVVIENSMALFNGNNGFKLGGEGLPVAHEVSGSLSYGNGMDGFTDNFNPGKLVLTDNISIDNQRFNYLLRKGPFTKSAEDQGILTDNVSVRTKPGRYADVVNGKQVEGNRFLDSTEPNTQGFKVKERSRGQIPPRLSDGKPDQSFFIER